MRYGYTTGTCAAAAAKGASAMLFSGRILDRVRVELPAGMELELELCEARLGDGWASCCVVKDAGDDPDVTDGIRVCARARRVEGEGIEVKGGEGVGVVTRPGLPVPPGSPAINPVPMAMIRKEVGEVLPEGAGVEVTIYVPGGEEVASRTFNPRLGIVGGISIIGTTGLVEPLSEEAYVKSIRMALSVLRAEGERRAAMVFGNQGERAARSLGIPERMVVKMGNFVGEMVDGLAEEGFSEALLLGHLGKVAKVAGGIFRTDGRVADGRFEVLGCHAALNGAGPDLIRGVLSSNTVEEAISLLEEAGLASTFDSICEAASRRCALRSGGKVLFGTVALDGSGRVVGSCPVGREMIEAWAGEERSG